MRTMTYSRYVMVKAMKPATHIARENGKQIVHVPDYDIDTDTASVAQFELIEDNQDRANAIKPGDVLGIENTEGGARVVDLQEVLTGGYSAPVCRGSYRLGTACGVCERCERELRASPGFPTVTDGAKINEEHAKANTLPGAHAGHCKWPMYPCDCHLPDTKGFHEGSRWGDGNGKVYVLRNGAWYPDSPPSAAHG